ncbi:MAG: hypothetical protein K8F91_17805, partial [Candidatus Obscuribacterales bacterium]|nr:hypothetical protein [Candidatus Obscuribacterales bacterium]
GLLSLAGIPDIDMLKELIANHPDTPSVVLDAISPGASDNVLQRICEHQNCSRKLLTLLADHKSCEVRMAVIENPNTPIEKIHVLAQDDCVDVRFRMAEAVNMMNEVLEELVLDENPYVSNRASTTLVRKQFESEGRQWDLHKAACQ